MPRKRTKAPVHKTDVLYRQMWRVVDGAVRDALAMHPDYLASGVQEKIVRNSINKRVVGALTGYAVEAWGRSGDESTPAANKEAGGSTPLASN